MTAYKMTARGLGLEIEGREILNEIDFDASCTRLAIVGRNGSGKSTIARLIAGLIEPSRGEILVDGIDPFEDRKGALQRIGVLFQNPDRQIIFPTVIEEMAFGLRAQGLQDPEGLARAVLEQFGRAHWEDAHCASLSQGQKHLLCLMAVLAMKPKIIVLDEPFAGLDIPTRAQLRRHLERFDGMLVHISHDPEDIRHYETALWLEGGQLRACGSVADVIPAYESEMHEIGARDDIADLTY